MKIKIYLQLLSLAMLTSCSDEIKKTEVKRVEFPVVQPMVLDTVYTSDYVADIHSRKNVEIRARVKGYLEQVYIDEGEHVSTGQKLFSITNQRYKEELLNAKAILKTAIAEAKNIELKVKNTILLVDKNVISKTELETEQSTLDAAKARIDAARSNEATAALNLSLTEIKAPFDGIVNRIPFKPGSLIDEETLLTSISDNKEVFAYFNMSEREYLNFIAQQKYNKTSEVSMVLANNEPFAYKGMIETVEGEFNKSTGNIAFRARFNNPEGLLKNGSSGKIKLTKKLNKALIIPQKSTFEIQDKIYVFVVDKNYKVEMRNVLPKYRLEHLYVISAGLKESDMIIYEGIQQVRAGDKIIPKRQHLRKMIAGKLN